MTKERKRAPWSALRAGDGRQLTPNTADSPSPFASRISGSLVFWRHEGISPEESGRVAALPRVRADAPRRRRGPTLVATGRAPAARTEIFQRHQPDCRFRGSRSWVPDGAPPIHLPIVLASVNLHDPTTERAPAQKVTSGAATAAPRSWPKRKSAVATQGR